jgi:GT2 family glycosyltransferase
MSGSMDEFNFIAVVVIGRNEGARLKACLDSIDDRSGFIVYVDSASSDGSVEVARNLGIDTVELDSSQPYTAARARNAGFDRANELMIDLGFVQFVDGDCLVDGHWLEVANAFLASRKDVAAVCGRLRERFPEKTVYNLLCDIEWDQPEGETSACGGNVFMRADAFKQTGGFREDLIAGEEPELCMRLQHEGWKIWRLPNEMVLHDADMTRFTQWWTRSARAGYTYAEGAHRLGRDCARQRTRPLVWGGVIPATLILGLVLIGPTALIVGAIYPMQMVRLALRETRGFRSSLIFAWFQVLGRFPEMCGVIKYYFNLATGRTTDLIEYKKPSVADSNPEKNEN